MAQYQAVADAFRVSQRESRLLTELAKRRAEAAKAEKGAAPKPSVTAQAGKVIEIRPTNLVTKYFAIIRFHGSQNIQPRSALFDSIHELVTDAEDYKQFWEVISVGKHTYDELDKALDEYKEAKAAYEKIGEEFKELKAKMDEVRSRLKTSSEKMYTADRNVISLTTRMRSE